VTEPTRKPPLPDPSGLERTMSPVDLPGDPVGEEAPVKWTAQIVAVASALLFLLNATSIRAWASELRPGPWTDPVIAAADAWYDTAARVGLTAPVETMHGWWQSVQEARFGRDAARQEPEEPARPQPRPGEAGPPTT
jgi:hypothetical protein